MSPDDTKLTIPDPVHFRFLLPGDMNVREVLDRFRPHWHREQDFGLDSRQPFTARDQPYVYVFRIDCDCHSLDVMVRESLNDRQ